MVDRKMAPPLRREELRSQMVTEADAFTMLRYMRQREQAPALWAMETEGARRLPGTPAVLADVFQALWSAGADLKPDDKVRADKRYWRGLLEQTMAGDSFHQLHAKTEGSSLLSLVGTIEAGQTLLGLVPKKDQEKLRELSQAAEKADESEAEAQSAEAQAQALEQMANDMMAQAGMSGAGSSGEPGDGQAGEAGQPGGDQSDGSPSGSSGQGLTAAQAQALADKLAEQWTEAQGKAEFARVQADADKAKADALADALMGKPGSAEAEQKMTELKRLGFGAAKKAEEKVSEISDTIQGWGLEEGELDRMEHPEAIGLLEKMRRSDAFKKFAKLLGRLRAMAAKKARSKSDEAGQKTTRQETGRDLNRAYPVELAALTHQATRVQSLIRWARGELRLRGEESKRPLGHGPVIVCEDGSGSMDGAKQQWAKGVTLALAHFAKLRRRAFGWVHFGATYSPLTSKSFPGGKMTATQMIEIAELFLNASGTDFEVPLRRAVEMIEKEGLKKADIILVTDGDCAVSEEFLKWFLAAKKRLEFTVVSVLCDSGDHVTDATVKQFSDRVDRASAFTAEEAETKIFSHL